MKNSDVERLLKNADFAAGSEHKKQLHGRLFPEAEGLAEQDELSDDELDLAAAGVHPSRRMPQRGKKG